MSSKQKTRVLLPHRLLGNIYVQELGRAYSNLGCEVVFGPENFFESNYQPDIVHMNWPEDLYRGFGSGKEEERVERLFGRLNQYKGDGAHIAWTVHNEKPHELSEGSIDSRVYQKIIDFADVIHHHCDCSQRLLSDRYEISPDTVQYVGAHGHYFSYRNDISQDEARRKLNLKPSGLVYLHFGAIRGYKGIDNVLDAFNRIKRKGDVLLVVGRFTGTGGLGERLKFAYYRYFATSLRIHLHMIDSDDIQMYINASDVMVLGHTSGLNSGVAVLGMTFGKPVIGPRLGCITSVLSQGENVLYEAGSIEDLAKGMSSVRNLNFDDIAYKNKAVAKFWAWEDIAAPVLDSYREK